MKSMFIAEIHEVFEPSGKARGTVACTNIAGE